MSGRRERKKRAVRAAVVDAASAMFERRGFEETRIDEIAEAADIAVGTVYNHFPTKSDILLAVLLTDVETVLQAAGTFDGPLSIASSVIDAMDRRPRHLWQHLFAESLTDGARLRPAFASVQEQFHALLLGMLGNEIDASIAHAIGFFAIYNYVLNELVTAAQAKHDIARGLERALHST
jgi:AcrR family transcriptional regulator